MIEVEVEDEAWRDLADVEALVEQAAEAALTLQSTRDPSPSMGVGQGWGCARDDVGRGREAPPALFTSAAARAPPSNPPSSRGRAHVTILLTDDATIRDLNARFRNKDTATNVLSFPAPDTAHPHLGDIALAYGVCAAEAAAQAKALADHLSHLVVHGVLHLLGYDHQADAPAEAMEAMERHILCRLAVADPYRQDPVHAGP